MLTNSGACMFGFFVFFPHISVINSSVHSTCYQVEQCTVIYVNTYSQKHLHVCANGTYAVSYGYNKLSVTYNGMVAAYLLELMARRYNRMVFKVFNILWTMDYGWHFADDIFKCILLNANVWFPFTISLKFVPKGMINNIPALVQMMAWHQPCNKSLSEPMMVLLLTPICITQPQWVDHSREHVHRSMSVENNILKKRNCII